MEFIEVIEELICRKYSNQISNSKIEQLCSKQDNFNLNTFGRAYLF